MNDERLLELLKRNDHSAYSELFDRYFRKLYIFALNVVFREDVANDIVQDVFIHIYEKSGLSDYSGSLKAYLFISVRNRCFNYLRDRKVDDRRMSLYLEASLCSDNLDLVEEEDLLKQIWCFMEGLPATCRDICYMRWREGLSIEEIASRLQVSESTVRVQLHRGVGRMRRYFEDFNIIMILFMIAF